MKGRQDTEYGVGGLPKGWCKTRVMLPAKRAGQVPDEHTGYFCCSEHMNQTCVSNAAAALIDAGQKLPELPQPRGREELLAGPDTKGPLAKGIDISTPPPAAARVDGSKPAAAKTDQKDEDAEEHRERVKDEEGKAKSGQKDDGGKEAPKRRFGRGQKG